MLKLLIAIFLFCFLCQSQSQTSFSVNPDRKTINYVASYLFTIADQMLRTTSSNLAFIQISFPPSLFNLNTSASWRCLNNDNISISYPCRAVDASTIQVDNPRIIVSVLRLTVTRIKNPMSAQPAIFGYKFLYSNGTIISLATTDVYREYVASSLRGCYLSLPPNITYTMSEMNFTILLSNKISTKGSISVEFPDSWLDALSWDQNPIIPSSENQTCAIKSVQNNLVQTFQCIRVENVVILKNVVTYIIPESSGIVFFSVSNVLSPRTFNSLNKVVVRTLSETYGQIDKGTCYLKASNPKLIQLGDIVDDFILGQIKQLTIEFIAPAPIGEGDFLKIITSSGTHQPFSELYIQGDVQISLQKSAITMISHNISLDTVTLEFPAGTIIPQYTLLRINKALLIKPLTPNGANFIHFGLFNPNMTQYAFANQSLTIFNQKILHSTSLDLSSYIVSTFSDYSFRLTLGNSLKPKSTISIEFPYNFKLIQGTCTASLQLLSTKDNEPKLVNCIAKGQLNVIELKYINENPLKAGDELLIKLRNLINPQSTEPSGNIIIRTFSGQNSTKTLDVSSNFSVAFVPAIIESPLMFLQHQFRASLVNWVIFYRVKSKFMADGSLRIGLPAQLQANSGQNISYQFSVIYTNSTISQQINNNFAQINSFQHLQLYNISSTILPVSTVIMIQFLNLATPTVIPSSLGFQLLQLDSKGYQVEKLSSPLVDLILYTTPIQIRHNYNITSITNQLPIILSISIGIIAICCVLLRSFGISFQFLILLAGVIGPFQISSWLRYMILFVELSGKNPNQDLQILSFQLLFGALLVNLVINLIGMIFVRKFILKVGRYLSLSSEIKGKGLTKCFEAMLLAMLVLTSHKFILLFFCQKNEIDAEEKIGERVQRKSGIKCLNYKRSDITYLNYPIMCSVFPSFMSIAAGIILFIQFIGSDMNNYMFGPATDIIALSFFSIFSSILIVIQNCIRKPIKIHDKMDSKLSQHISQTTAANISNSSHLYTKAETSNEINNDSQIRLFDAVTPKLKKRIKREKSTLKQQTKIKPKRKKSNLK